MFLFFKFLSPYFPTFSFFTQPGFCSIITQYNKKGLSNNLIFETESPRQCALLRIAFYISILQFFSKMSPPIISKRVGNRRKIYPPPLIRVGKRVGWHKFSRATCRKRKMRVSSAAHTALEMLSCICCIHQQNSRHFEPAKNSRQFPNVFQASDLLFTKKQKQTKVPIDKFIYAKELSS